MASTSRSRRAAAGIALIVAGALIVLAVLLPLVGIALSWLMPLAYLALAAALVILALGAVNSTIAKIALFAGAAGWLLLGLAGFGLGLAGIGTIAVVLAVAGTLVGAIVLYAGKEVRNQAALVFLIAAILGLLVLLPALGVTALSMLGTILVVLFGAALIVSGVLFRQAENRR